jgi:hypothetical protein
VNGDYAIGDQEIAWLHFTTHAKVSDGVVERLRLTAAIGIGGAAVTFINVNVTELRLIEGGVSVSGVIFGAEAELVLSYGGIDGGFPTLVADGVNRPKSVTVAWATELYESFAVITDFSSQAVCQNWLHVSTITPDSKKPIGYSLECKIEGDSWCLVAVGKDNRGILDKIPGGLTTVIVVAAVIAVCIAVFLWCKCCKGKGAKQKKGAKKGAKKQNKNRVATSSSSGSSSSSSSSRSSLSSSKEPARDRRPAGRPAAV